MPFRAVLGLFLGLALAIRAEHQPPKSFDLPAIDKYLEAEVAAKEYVGLSVAIMRDGKIVFAKGYGNASLKDGRVLDSHTRLAAGSVTKQFTSACIFLLAEDGKLSIHDNVSKFFPKLTKADDITLYDLMSHVSGYPDYYPLDFVDRRMEKTIQLDDLLKDYAGGKLDFPPRTRWSYSNTGYILLGRVVEKASGQSFEKFLSERILKPLEMTDTVFEPKDGDKGLAIGYTSFALGAAEPAPREATGWIHAAGGLYTTPTDLLKWDLALISGKLIKPGSFTLMTTPRQLSDGRTQDYGCGLSIRRRDGELVLGHGGAVSGFQTYNAILPRPRSAVAVMTNDERPDTDGVVKPLITLLAKADGASPTPIPKITGPAPKEVAIDLLKQLQAGEVKRAALGDDFSHFLSDERIKGAAERLKPLGDPDSVEVENTAERGGMEVAVIKFTFKKLTVTGLLYRTPDGKVQEFLLKKG